MSIKTVVAAALGEMLGICVRGMTSIIRQACIIRERDYWAVGRTVESLGLSNMHSETLLSLVKDGDLVTRSTINSAWSRAFVN